MKIDFSWSTADWMALIKEFLQIIQNFFKEIGINIFSTDDGEGASEDASAENEGE